jgi:hypothetical protein
MATQPEVNNVPFARTMREYLCPSNFEIQGYYSQWQEPLWYPPNNSPQYAFQKPVVDSNASQPSNEQSLEDTLQMFLQGHSKTIEQNRQAFGDIHSQLTNLNNIFNVERQNGDDDEFRGVNHIDTLDQEQENSHVFPDPLEIGLTAEETTFLDSPELECLSSLVNDEAMGIESWVPIVDESPPDKPQTYLSIDQSVPLEIQIFSKQVETDPPDNTEYSLVVILPIQKNQQESKLLGLSDQHQQVMSWHLRLDHFSPPFTDPILERKYGHSGYNLIVVSLVDQAQSHVPYPFGTFPLKILILRNRLRCCVTLSMGGPMQAMWTPVLWVRELYLKSRRL